MPDRNAKLGPRFGEALKLAFDLHGADVRKGKSTPYIAHLLGVCDLVLQDGGSEDEAIAALLHDALEDKPKEITAKDLESRFGTNVAEIVRGCTDTPEDYSGGTKAPWRDRKEAYLAHLGSASPGTRRVSLADKLYNLREIVADLEQHGSEIWSRFNAGRDQQIWYYRSVLSRMRDAGQSGPMMDQFEAKVGELERVAGAE